MYMISVRKLILYMKYLIKVIKEHKAIQLNSLIAILKSHDPNGGSSLAKSLQSAL